MKYNFIKNEILKEQTIDSPFNGKVIHEAPARMLTAGEDSPRLKAKNALGSTIKVLTTINHMRRCSNEV